MRTRGFEVLNPTDIFKKPRRATSRSAGYDIYNNTCDDIVIKPGTTSNAIPTGINAYMQEDERLELHVRSGHGFKYSVRLANSTGIIDADYYPREIFLKFKNGGDKELVIKAGEAMAQGIFSKYLVTDDDVLSVGGERTGGFGSTSDVKN